MRATAAVHSQQPASADPNTLATSAANCDQEKPPQHAADTPSSSHSPDRQLAAGAFLETTEAQLTIVLLVALDVCCAAAQMHLRTQQVVDHLRAVIDASDASTSATAPPIAPIAPRASGSSVLLTLGAQLVDSFSGFTIFFFLIELAVLAAAFRRRFFTHLGYVLDVVVITLAISYEIYAQSKALRLLGVLRVWRVFRLVDTLVERERRAHDATKDALELEQLKALVLETEKQAARESLEREYKSRDALEQLLQSYKDEVETLKEALQIAAEAVAEADLQRLMTPSDAPHALAPVQEDAAATTGEQEATEYANWSYAQDPYAPSDGVAAYDSWQYGEQVMAPTDELATAAEALREERESERSGEQDEPRVAETTTTTTVTGDDEFADAVEG